MTNHVEHLFVGLLAIYIHFFGEMSIQVFAPFSIGGFVPVLFLILEGETPVLPTGVRLATGSARVAFVTWWTLLLPLVTDWLYDERVQPVVRCISCI